jgi:glycosyltransferase involved in cell wall biosynthesis
LYRVALARSSTVFFQNADDREVFLSARLVDPAVTQCLPGSGIDLARFSPAAHHSEQGLRFLLISRLLRDKGVLEYVQAARQLRHELPGAEFQLLGFLEPNHSLAITEEEVRAWVAEGVVTYLGASDDVRPFIAQADCVVLPSYREGVPRALLEAASMQRPIVTTDAPGCREVVIDGENGLLCRVKDSTDLAAKMRTLAGLPLARRQEMGRLGRQRMESLFDEKRVIEAYLQAVAFATAHRSDG